MLNGATLKLMATYFKSIELILVISSDVLIPVPDPNPDLDFDDI